MVLAKTRWRQTLKKRCLLWFGGLILFLLVGGASFAVCFMIVSLNQSEQPTEEEIVVIRPDDEPQKPAKPTVKTIDFQATIDNWAASAGGQKGIIIYDLDLDKTVGSYNADQKFATASLYKLFVVYEGYRRVQNGTMDANAIAGSTGYTVGECLDLAIRESYSPCAETIWAMVGRDELDSIVQNDFKMPNMVVSDLEATPAEIMQILKIYYEHSDVKDETLLTKMKDSFLNQPITTYDWRQGLPKGFSDKALVYNKVGWNWDGRVWQIYDDAAIVNFVNENRSFIVVVMASGVTFQSIRSLGSQIEQTFYNVYQ